MKMVNPTGSPTSAPLSIHSTSLLELQRDPSEGIGGATPEPCPLLELGVKGGPYSP